MQLHSLKPITSPSLPNLATEILQYLLRHPSAEDTIEGIVHWWLVEQRLIQALSQVRTALSQLHHQGFVASRTLADGRVLYRLEPTRQQEAAATLDRLRQVQGG